MQGLKKSTCPNLIMQTSSSITGLALVVAVACITGLTLVVAVA